MADNDSKKKPDFRMADIIEAYMASEESKDSEGQKELRKDFPIQVVLACVRVAVEGAIEFIKALDEIEDGEKAAQAMIEYIEGPGVNRLIDLYQTTVALEYAWENCRLEDGNIFIGDDKIVPTPIIH